MNATLNQPVTSDLGESRVQEITTSDKSRAWGVLAFECLKLPNELKTMVPAGLLQLEFSDQVQLAAAQSALDEHYHTNPDDSKLVVATTGSVAEMADIFIRLRDSGIEPTRYARQTATLDDVFLKILDEEREDSHANSA